MKCIVTADWHLRGDRPRCRTDADWLDMQRRCIREVFNLALDIGCQLFVVGDIFNTPRVSTEVLCMAVSEFSNFVARGGEVQILAGNHDLPYHNYDLVSQCSFGVLQAIVPVIQCTSSVEAFPFGRDQHLGRKFAFTHQLVFPDKASIPPGCEAATAQEVLKAFPSQFVFTGDYHHAFISQATDDATRYLVNPGCLIRQSTDMANYRPKVAIVDSDNDKSPCEFHELSSDVAPELVSREHIVLQEERNSRIEAFVQQLKGSEGISLHFLENVEAQMLTLPEEVQAMVQEIIQKSKDTAKETT